jgi:alkylated DNA repair dioxygenase AlkB
MQQSLFRLVEGVNVLPFDGEALFYPGILSAEESDNYFKELLRDTPWTQQTIKIYDKEMLQPRLTAFYGDNARELLYSENSLPALPWTLPLLRLKEKVEYISDVRFTHALLNLYRDGKDSVAWHRDKEKVWGPEPIIGSLSLGAARTFQFRTYSDKKNIRSIELTPGSFLLMRGLTQKMWEHQIPKTNKRIGARINITFRILV